MNMFLVHLQILLTSISAFTYADLGFHNNLHAHEVLEPFLPS